MIKARVATGEVVELKKDCGCLDEIHVGPHWLYMDDYKRRRSAELVQQADALGNGGLVKDRVTFMRKEALLNRAFQLEIVRLGEKVREMERRGIEEIVR